MTLRGFFSSCATCSPLRHALYTGIYPVRSGAYPNHTMVDPGTSKAGQIPLDARSGDTIARAAWTPPPPRVAR